MSKTLCGAVLTLLLTTIVIVLFCTQPVEAGETIYIQADGLVSPSTAPIQRNGDVYTFTDNISDSIWVLRDNIVIDGAGYTLQGTGSIVQGIRLAGRTNVTVQNTQIKTFQNGIVISDYSSNITISGNTITNTNNGLWVRYSSGNSISGNNIANNSYGMRLEYSSSNSISGNTITNERGVYFYNSSSNSISGNTITNTYYGVQLESYSNFNTVSENNIIANTNSGIVLSGSSNNNTISGNNIANNGEGISLTYSSVSSNRIYHNNFIDNTQQAYSLGIGNSWDDGYPSGGNYWSDYTGVDANGDGIGDTPYIINANNQDRYPLMSTYGPDITPPTTSYDYDGSWRTTDFTITLTATDDKSGVAETCYKINGGETKNVTAHGQPTFATESANHTLEYWSIDNADNEELPHKILTGIKLDKTAPTGSTVINNGDASTTSTSVTLTLTSSDVTSGVYQVRYSNDGVWDTEPWETPASTKAWTLTSGDGTKTVYYQIRDNAGLVSTTYSDNISLQSPTPSPSPSPSPEPSPSPSPTPTPEPTPEPEPTPSPSPSPEPTPSPTPPPEEPPLLPYAIIAVPVVVALIGTAAFLLKKRR